MRYKCIVEYDGTNFHGFQIQKNLRTVEKVIEDVLEVITKKKTIIYGAGRTDAGVHSYGQVFHFDYDIKIKPNSMKEALNSRLPSDVHIKSVEFVDEEFHARYSAKSKTYKYVIDTNEVDPLYSNYRWYFKYPFDYEKLICASKVFIGEHDFASFTKNHDLENTVRTIYSIDISKDSGVITMLFRGNGFLHNQVRIIVAMMMEVAKGKLEVKDLENIMNACNRKLSPKTAPANGLYLMSVEY